MRRRTGVSREERRALFRSALGLMVFSLGPLALFATGCGSLSRAAVTASQVFSAARELSGIVEAVASRVLGHGVPDAVSEAVYRAMVAIDAVSHASNASEAMLPPDEARALFDRFFAAYEALWLALKAAGMLGPDGQLLGVGDGGLIPSPDDCRRCAARHLGSES